MAAEAIRRRPVGRRIGGLLLALVNLAGAVVVAFFGLIADGLRCDDNCSVAPGWRNDPSAWQWHGVLVLALVILGSALVLTVRRDRRKPGKGRVDILDDAGMALTQLAPGSPEVLALFEQRRRAYVDSATVGLPPRPTVEALKRALRSWQAGTAKWEEDWEPAGELCRHEIAPMLGAPAEEIALVPAVSVGVAPVAAALGPEDEVVVPEDEFDSLLLPLIAVAERRGARVRRVPFREVAGAVGPRTTVVATSHVKSNGGAVQDLDAVAAGAAGVGARVVVDATHSAGLLPIEAADRGLDVVVAAAYKHLLCPRGVAFARMAPEAQHVYAPVSASWVSVDPRSYYGSGVAQLANDARRFDVSLAWHAWVGALESLRFLNTIPAEERCRWCVSLASELADRVGVEPTGSSFLSVPVEVPPAELIKQLAAADVAAAIRTGEVRVSFHVYNTRADVDYVASVLRTMRR